MSTTAALNSTNMSNATSTRATPSTQKHAPSRSTYQRQPPTGSVREQRQQNLQQVIMSMPPQKRSNGANGTAATTTNDVDPSATSPLPPSILHITTTRLHSTGQILSQTQTRTTSHEFMNVPSSSEEQPSKPLVGKTTMRFRLASVKGGDGGGVEQDEAEDGGEDGEEDGRSKTRVRRDIEERRKMMEAAATLHQQEEKEMSNDSATKPSTIDPSVIATSPLPPQPQRSISGLDHIDFTTVSSSLLSLLRGTPVHDVFSTKLSSFFKEIQSHFLLVEEVQREKEGMKKKHDLLIQAAKDAERDLRQVKDSSSSAHLTVRQQSLLLQNRTRELRITKEVYAEHISRLKDLCVLNGMDLETLKQIVPVANESLVKRMEKAAEMERMKSGAGGSNLSPDTNDGTSTPRVVPTDALSLFSTSDDNSTSSDSSTSLTSSAFSLSPAITSKIQTIIDHRMSLLISSMKSSVFQVLQELTKKLEESNAKVRTVDVYLSKSRYRMKKQAYVYDLLLKGLLTPEMITEIQVKHKKEQEEAAAQAAAQAAAALANPDSSLATASSSSQHSRQHSSQTTPSHAAQQRKMLHISTGATASVASGIGVTTVVLPGTSTTTEPPEWSALSSTHPLSYSLLVSLQARHKLHLDKLWQHIRDSTNDSSSDAATTTMNGVESLDEDERRELIENIWQLTKNSAWMMSGTSVTTGEGKSTGLSRKSTYASVGFSTRATSNATTPRGGGGARKFSLPSSEHGGGGGGGSENNNPEAEMYGNQQNNDGGSESGGESLPSTPRGGGDKSSSNNTTRGEKSGSSRKKSSKAPPASKGGRPTFSRVSSVSSTSGALSKSIGHTRSDSNSTLSGGQSSSNDSSRRTTSGLQGNESNGELLGARSASRQQQHERKSSFANIKGASTNSGRTSRKELPTSTNAASSSSSRRKQKRTESFDDGTASDSSTGTSTSITAHTLNTPHASSTQAGGGGGVGAGSRPMTPTSLSVPRPLTPSSNPSTEDPLAARRRAIQQSWSSIEKDADEREKALLAAAEGKDRPSSRQGVDQEEQENKKFETERMKSAAREQKEREAEERKALRRERKERAEQNRFKMPTSPSPDRERSSRGGEIPSIPTVAFANSNSSSDPHSLSLSVSTSHAPSEPRTSTPSPRGEHGSLIGGGGRRLHEAGGMKGVETGSLMRVPTLTASNTTTDHAHTSLGHSRNLSGSSSPGGNDSATTTPRSALRTQPQQLKAQYDASRLQHGGGKPRSISPQPSALQQEINSIDRELLSNTTAYSLLERKNREILDKIRALDLDRLSNNNNNRHIINSGPTSGFTSVGGGNTKSGTMTVTSLGSMQSTRRNSWDGGGKSNFPSMIHAASGSTRDNEDTLSVHDHHHHHSRHDRAVSPAPTPIDDASSIAAHEQAKSDRASRIQQASAFERQKKELERERKLTEKENQRLNAKLKLLEQRKSEIENGQATAAAVAAATIAAQQSEKQPRVLRPRSSVQPPTAAATDVREHENIFQKVVMRSVGLQVGVPFTYTMMQQSGGGGEEEKANDNEEQADDEHSNTEPHRPVSLSTIQPQDPLHHEPFNQGVTPTPAHIQVNTLAYQMQSIGIDPALIQSFLQYQFLHSRRSHSAVAHLDGDGNGATSSSGFVPLSYLEGGDDPADAIHSHPILTGSTRHSRSRSPSRRREAPEHHGTLSNISQSLTLSPSERDLQFRRELTRRKSIESSLTIFNRLHARGNTAEETTRHMRGVKQYERTREMERVLKDLDLLQSNMSNTTAPTAVLQQVDTDTTRSRSPSRPTSAVHVRPRTNREYQDAATSSNSASATNSLAPSRPTTARRQQPQPQYSHLMSRNGTYNAPSSLMDNSSRDAGVSTDLGAWSAEVAQKQQQLQQQQQHHHSSSGRRSTFTPSASASSSFGATSYTQQLLASSGRPPRPMSALLHQ